MASARRGRSGSSENRSSLHNMLSSIKRERSRVQRGDSGEGGFVVLAINTFWTKVFSEYLVDSGSDDLRDDMLFFIRKISHARDQQPVTEVDVYRRDSKRLPSPGDPSIDWEETVYLNLILQQFEYQLTCAVCTKEGKELTVHKRYSSRVYASPNKHRMDRKDTESEVSYPNIFFMIDNFDEVFGDISVQEGEMVCVELLARYRQDSFKSVIFLGSIRYEALKKVYDGRASVTSKMAQRMSLGLYHGKERVEFVRMKGPQGKGYAEMAVSRLTDGMPTSRSEDDLRFSRESRGHGRNSNGAMSHSLSQPTDMKKSTSLNERADFDRIQGKDRRQGPRDGSSRGVAKAGGAFSWLKGRQRSSGGLFVLNAHLTYVTLPWQRIVADILENRQPPVLSA
ncbi:uncharacterized protein KIAA0930-like [Branchiostoma floridae]|uniref:Uncharacterized protein KIAA0930-like n=1 Tax=Branchiostoma floridae TaxID=7739 RepID=A0A9J7KZT3_BRAFL|nr:uncharacterized protein KIAA0930-like [Branchiostoma floridae]